MSAGLVSGRHRRWANVAFSSTALRADFQLKDTRDVGRTALATRVQDAAPGPCSLVQSRSRKLTKVDYVSNGILLMVGDKYIGSRYTKADE